LPPTPRRAWPTALRKLAAQAAVLPLALEAWRCIRSDRDPLPQEVEVHLNAVTRQPAAATELPWLRLVLVLGITVSNTFRRFITAESPFETDAIKAFYVSRRRRRRRRHVTPVTSGGASERIRRVARAHGPVHELRRTIERIAPGIHRRFQRRCRRGGQQQQQ